jgi:hypothetical protein
LGATAMCHNGRGRTTMGRNGDRFKAVGATGWSSTALVRNGNVPQQMGHYGNGA